MKLYKPTTRPSGSGLYVYKYINEWVDPEFICDVEEVELPTEEEIMLALVDNYGNDLATTRKTIAATKAITNLLKGGI